MDVIQYELLKLKWALPDSNRELNKVLHNILIIRPLLKYFMLSRHVQGKYYSLPTK